MKHLLLTVAALSFFYSPSRCLLAAEEAKPLFHVAANGNDQWSGKPATPKDGDGPFATLDKARDEIRKLVKAGLPKGGVTVVVGEGTHELAKPFTLKGAEDSGTADAPIVYRAAPGAKVVLTGGCTVKGFKPVADQAILARLDESARGHVLKADLKAAGLTDFGGGPLAGKQAELFCDDVPMTIARWPNEGFVKIVDVAGGQPIDVRGAKGDKSGKFIYDGDRPTRWAEDKDAWLHGYWFWDWADSRQRVEAIDRAARTITLAPPQHSYGYRKGQRYYAMNLLSELNSPGEWYLDRASGMLYFWPPLAVASIEKAKVVLSVCPTLVSLTGVSHVTFRGLALEVCRLTAVTVSGGTEVRFAGCTIRNTGAWAIAMSGGTKHAVVGCDIYQTGEGGIQLSGGDRKTLTPAGHVVENNHIHAFGRVVRTYRPAVGVDGVGQRVAHNLIHDGPHNAIQLMGNDHLIEFNEIHSVCYETGDVGAFYTGRDWTVRGNVIRHNYFHHIHGPGQYGAMSVYLDDAVGGFTVFGNVFYKAGRAAFIGGGRDNLVENNVFVDCTPSVNVDARGLGWMRDHVQTGGTLPTRLKAVPYQQPPWSERYPQLVNILDDQPGAPKGNVVVRNISIGGKWANIEKAAEPLVKLENNLVDKDPLFVDAARMDFQLREDSPAFALGFKRIPIEKIGPYKDELRASWPLTHRVRDVTPPSPPPAGRP